MRNYKIILSRIVVVLYFFIGVIYVVLLPVYEVLETIRGKDELKYLLNFMLISVIVFLFFLKVFLYAVEGKE